MFADSNGEGSLTFRSPGSLPGSDSARYESLDHSQHRPAAENRSVEVVPARRVLQRLARRYPLRIAAAVSVALVENALLVLYPLAAGFAIDSVVHGDIANAIAYVGVVFAFWGLGAVRRAMDTRIYAGIFAEVAPEVVHAQRCTGEEVGTIAARAQFARAAVDFLEEEIPAILTALVSVLGSTLMLALVAPATGIATLLALVGFTPFIVWYARRTQILNAGMNDRLEREVAVIARGRRLGLRRHYTQLARWRVRLSDAEAKAYLSIGVVAAALFGFALWRLSIGKETSPGQVYTVLAYLWTFAESLDTLPYLLQQLGRMRDIGGRIAHGVLGDPSQQTSPEVKMTPKAPVRGVLSPAIDPLSGPMAVSLMDP